MADPAASAAKQSDQRTVSFLCSLCGTLMDATVEQAGQEVTCPDCGTAAIVPSASKPSPPPAGPTPSSTPGIADVYNVLEGQGQPPPNVTEVYRRHIPVVCLLCHTRMHATEEQVGQVLVCPDCGTANIVPAAPANESPAALLAAVEGYELAATNDAPASTAPKDRHEFVFTCPLCRTRLQAARDRAGQAMTCPDCGTGFPVPQPSAEEARLDPFEEAVGIYAVMGGAPPAPAADRGPSPSPQAVNLAALSETRPALADRDLLPPRQPEREMPPWPLVNGVLTFPFHPNSLIYCGKLAVGGVAFAGLFTAVTFMLLSGGYGAVFGAVLSVPTALFGMIYGSWVLSSQSRVLTETANGADEIEEWVNPDFSAWIFESIYLANALALGAAVGWVVELLTGGVLHGAAVAASVFLLSPVILLSFLETGVALNPISLAVLGSLFSRWWAWWGFYGLAAVLVSATAATTYGLWLLVGTASAIPSAILMALAVMIYFRLLGRLGWYITVNKRSTKKRRDSASEQAGE